MPKILESYYKFYHAKHNVMCWWRVGKRCLPSKTELLLCSHFVKNVSLKNVIITWRNLISKFQGDSGGPLNCFDVKSEKWELCGVISFGYRCGTCKIVLIYTFYRSLTEKVHLSKNISNLLFFYFQHFPEYILEFPNTWIGFRASYIKSTSHKTFHYT